MTLDKGKEEESYYVTSVEGTQKTKDFLQTLGFLKGSRVTIITKGFNNYIVNVKDCRYGIDRVLASKIQVVKEGGDS